MKFNIYDLYLSKYNNLFNIMLKIANIILLIIIVTFLDTNDLKVIYRFLTFSYLLLNIFNVFLIKMRNLDLYFINNRRKVFKVYLFLIIYEVFWQLILVTPYLIKYDFNSYINIFIFNAYYLVFTYLFFVASVKLGFIFSLLFIFINLFNIFLNTEIIEILFINLSFSKVILINSNLYINFLLLSVIFIFSYNYYKFSSYRNIF